VDATRSGFSAKSFVFALYSLMVLIVVASYLLVHLMGYGFMFFTSEGLTFSMRSFNFPVLILFLLAFIIPIPLRVGAVFSFVWIVYSLCFVTAWKGRQSFHAVFRRPASANWRNVFSNFLFAMPLLSGMALTAALAIIYSQSAVGIETGVPQLPPDPHEAFLNLAYAPLIEELAFRLVPIGFLVVFYVFLLGKYPRGFSTIANRLKLFFLAFVYPEGAKKVSRLPTVSEHGVLRGISPIEWVMIVVTSVIFALAHVLSPVGWEIGKVTSVFVQGVFFAFAYVAYGFEAPILLHWYFNYYFYFFEPEVAERFFPATIGLLSSIEVLIFVVGILGWVGFAVAGLGKFVRLKKKPVQSVLPPVANS